MLGISLKFTNSQKQKVITALEIHTRNLTQGEKPVYNLALKKVKNPTGPFDGMLMRCIENALNAQETAECKELASSVAEQRLNFQRAAIQQPVIGA